LIRNDFEILELGNFGIGGLTHLQLIIYTFAPLQTRAIVPMLSWEGKSGQRRATYRLRAGSPCKNGKEKVPQKITTPDENREKR